MYIYRKDKKGEKKKREKKRQQERGQIYLLISL
jgi:hypothetical protein